LKFAIWHQVSGLGTGVRRPPAGLRILTFVLHVLPDSLDFFPGTTEVGLYQGLLCVRPESAKMTKKTEFVLFNKIRLISWVTFWADEKDASHYDLGESAFEDK